MPLLISGSFASHDMLTDHSYSLPSAAVSGTDVNTYTRERPGMSAFALEDGVVYHSYSAYSREVDGLWACINGSISRLKDATRMASSGGAVMTNTTEPVGIRRFKRLLSLSQRCEPHRRGLALLVGTRRFASQIVTLLGDRF